MKLLILLGAATLAFGTGFASAASLSNNPPKSATICLDGGGHLMPVHCRTIDASRLVARDDVCICPGATLQVTAPVCGPGVKPPGENAAYEQERLKAVSHGSLMDASWRGQAMCVAPRNR